MWHQQYGVDNSEGVHCIVNLGLADEAGVEVQVVWHDDRTHCCHTLSILIDGGVRKMQRKSHHQISD